MDSGAYDVFGLGFQIQSLVDKFHRQSAYKTSEKRVTRHGPRHIINRTKKLEKMKVSKKCRNVKDECIEGEREGAMRKEVDCIPD